MGERARKSEKSVQIAARWQCVSAHDVKNLAPLNFFLYNRGFPASMPAGERGNPTRESLRQRQRASPYKQDKKQGTAFFLDRS
jgi:hypothetical protein